MHASRPKRNPKTRVGDFNEAENGAAFWRESAQRRLRETLARQPVTTPAKNVIMFLGDGMSIPTLAAARIYQGQSQDPPVSGEEQQLSFEKFPYTGLSKTYCVDAQVADSACSATAYLGGVKGNIATIGVTGAVPEYNCGEMLKPENQVTSIMHWAQAAGKSTGVVTTTRVTHASPAGAYAHTASRDWESDADMKGVEGASAATCPDIAQQLIFGETGKNFRVILGGGRREFLSKQDEDPEYGTRGRRLDGQNLIDAWLHDKEQRGVSAQFVWNGPGLAAVDTSTNEYLLGLFEPSHMQYHLESMYNKSEPTLEEMTVAAIETLSTDPNGFVLFVEGGRIDQGHHGTNAKHALDEAVEMAKAVQRAAELTSERDTLIVVTADHSHTLTISGYPDRGNDIFGEAGMSKVDDKAYATLSYANGPGYEHAQDTNNCTRHDLDEDDMHDDEYTFPALAPLSSETHGGDDVAVLSRGPFAHLLTGVFEQNYIPHVMAYAACVGRGATACDGAARRH